MTNIESKLAEQVANEQRAKQKLLNHFGCQTVDEFYQKYGIDFTKTSIIVSAMVAYQNIYTEQLQMDLKVTESLLNERQRLLDAIPECPEHGKCVPYALEWIEKAKAKATKQKTTK